MTAWGIRQACQRCGRDSFTGEVCTHCTVMPAIQGRPIEPYRFKPVAAVEADEREPVIPPELACPLYVYSDAPARLPGCGHDAPAVVRHLAGEAVERGWRVASQHSRGGVVGGTGKQLAVAELWSVRFRRDGWSGYAVRRGAAWSSVWVAGERLPAFGKLGVTELLHWLELPDRDASWYGEVLGRKAAQTLAAKVVPCPSGCQVDYLHTHRGNGDVKAKTVRAAEHGG